MPTEGGRIRWVGPHAVVAMPAEMDAVNAEEIRQELISAVSLGAAVVVIDMSETMFCDSAGVQAIIAAYQQAAMTGTKLRLAATEVLRILTVIGVSQLIPIYPTLDSALAAHPAQAGPPEPGEATTSGDPPAQAPPAGA